MGWIHRGESDKGWGYDEWLWLGRWVGLGCETGSVLDGVGCVWC